MGKEMSLGEFVKLFTALLHSKKIEMPFQDEEPWHDLFYKLKMDNARGKPAFFDLLRFDWDGPYPKSRELSEFLHALHWNASVSAPNPNFETITLDNGVADLWLSRLNQLDGDTKRFLETARDKFSEKRRSQATANADST